MVFAVIGRSGIADILVYSQGSINIEDESVVLFVRSKGFIERAIGFKESTGSFLVIIWKINGRKINIAFNISVLETSIVSSEIELALSCNIISISSFATRE